MLYDSAFERQFLKTQSTLCRQRLIFPLYRLLVGIYLFLPIISPEDAEKFSHKQRKPF